MNKSTLIFILVLVLSVSFFLEAQDTGESDKSQALKMHIWQLKQCLLNPQVWTLDGMDSRHSSNIGIEATRIGKDASILSGLKEGQGIKVESIYAKSTIRSGLAIGDIIARCKSLSGNWVPVDMDTIEYLYLPGDEACLEVIRSKEYLVVRVPVICKCGKVDSCAFKSPFVDNRLSTISFHELPRISRENVIEMYTSAVEAWAKDFKNAKPEDRGKVDFMIYLNKASRKNGAKDWTDYCTKAATRMGAEEWTKVVEELVAMQIVIMKRLTEEIEKESESNPEARIEANETSAIGTLKAISAGEEQFRTASCVDANRNGIGEYGFLTELSGKQECRISGILTTNSPYIPSLFDADISARKGYYFAVFLCNSDDGSSGTEVYGPKACISAEQAGINEENYLCYAWPIEAGKTGTRVFVISSMGTIMQNPNDVSNPISGLNRPPAWCAAINGFSNWVRGTFVANGQTGNDVNMPKPWKIID